MVVLTLVCSWDREGMNTQQLGGHPWNSEVMDVGVGMAPSPSKQENCTYLTGKGWVIKCEYAGYVWRSLEADQLLAISNLYGIHVQQSHSKTSKASDEKDDQESYVEATKIVHIEAHNDNRLDDH